MKIINKIFKLLLLGIVVLNNGVFTMNLPIMKPSSDPKETVKNSAIRKTALPLAFLNKFRSSQTLQARDTLSEKICRSILFFSAADESLYPITTSWDTIQTSSKELDQAIAEKSNEIYNNIKILTQDKNIDDIPLVFNNIVKIFKNKNNYEKFLNEIVSKLLTIKIPISQDLEFSNDMNDNIEIVEKKFNLFFNKILKISAIKPTKCKSEDLSNLIRKIEESDTDKKDRIIRNYLKECLNNIEPHIIEFIFNRSNLPNCLEIIFDRDEGRIKNIIQKAGGYNENIVNIIYNMLYIENVYDKHKELMLKDIYKNTKLSLDILNAAINKVSLHESKSSPCLLDQKNFICLAINFISKDNVLSSAQNYIEENLKQESFSSQNKDNIKIILLCFDICCTNSDKIKNLIEIYNQFCKHIGQNEEIVCFVSEDLKKTIKNNKKYDELQTLIQYPEILCLDSSLEENKLERKNAYIIDFVSILNKILSSQIDKAKLPFIFSFQKDHLTSPDIRIYENSRAITGCHFSSQQNKPIIHFDSSTDDIQDLKITEEKMLEHPNGITCIILKLNKAQDKISTCFRQEYINNICDIILNTLNNILKTKKEDTAIFWDNISQGFILETFFSRDIAIQVKTVYPVLTCTIRSNEQVRESDEKYKEVATKINKIKILLSNSPKNLINQIAESQDPNNYIQVIKSMLFCANHELPFSEESIIALGNMYTYKKSKNSTRRRDRNKCTPAMALNILDAISNLKSKKLDTLTKLEELPLYQNIIDGIWIQKPNIANILLHNAIGKNLDELKKMDSQQLVNSLDLDVNSSINLDIIINNLDELSKIKDIKTENNFICVTLKITNELDLPVYFAMNNEVQ